MACQFIALLVQALIELLVRWLMVAQGLSNIKISPGARPSSAPGATRVLELFKGPATTPPHRRRRSPRADVLARTDSEATPTPWPPGNFTRSLPVSGGRIWVLRSAEREI